MVLCEQVMKLVTSGLDSTLTVWNISLKVFIILFRIEFCKP